VGFLISYGQSRLKKKLNKLGVVDSNSAVFHFLIPSLFAAILSSIEQGSGKSAASYTAISFNSNSSSFNTFPINYPALVGSGRPEPTQGVYQLAGWAISVALGGATGAIIGVIYRLLNDSFREVWHFFNDGTLFHFPKGKPDEER
jgi:hypothetical protein